MKCQAESEADKPGNDTAVSELKSQNLSVEDVCKSETMNSVLWKKNRQEAINVYEQNGMQPSNEHLDAKEQNLKQDPNEVKLGKVHA